jgi:hypothetical protein
MGLLSSAISCRGMPLRMNPFEVRGPIPISVYLDLMRSAFNASFGMWTPLPQVLEICLQAVYEDRGWDLTCGTNARLRDGDDRTASFPRMTSWRRHSRARACPMPRKPAARRIR